MKKILIFGTESEVLVGEVVVTKNILYLFSARIVTVHAALQTSLFNEV